MKKIYFYNAGVYEISTKGNEVYLLLNLVEDDNDKERAIHFLCENDENVEFLDFVGVNCDLKCEEMVLQQISDEDEVLYISKKYSEVRDYLELKVSEEFEFVWEE